MGEGHADSWGRGRLRSAPLGSVRLFSAPLGSRGAVPWGHLHPALLRSPSFQEPPLHRVLTHLIVSNPLRTAYLSPPPCTDSSHRALSPSGSVLNPLTAHRSPHHAHPPTPCTDPSTTHRPHHLNRAPFSAARPAAQTNDAMSGVCTPPQVPPSTGCTRVQPLCRSSTAWCHGPIGGTDLECQTPAAQSLSPLNLSPALGMVPALAQVGPWGINHLFGHPKTVGNNVALCHSCRTGNSLG